MELNFRVQGSEPEPYLITFMFDGNLKATCNCKAGQKYMLCKHIISLLVGDVTSLVSDNADDINVLHDYLEKDKELKDIYLLFYDSLIAKKKLEEKFILKPKSRRKRIEKSQAIEILQNNGFLKGNSGANFLDVYNSSNDYIGSLKTKQSVFNCLLSDVVGIKGLRKRHFIDKQLHENSLGLYAFMPNSEFHTIIEQEEEYRDRKIKLAKTIIYRPIKNPEVNELNNYQTISIEGQVTEKPNLFLRFLSIFKK